MRYLITLAPLEAFFFGGDRTFGTLGDKESGSYLVKSRQFPQQSALLGMLKKEMMIQAGLLTRKLRGEWVDKQNKKEAETLVGDEKFDIDSKIEQNFGKIESISPIFLIRDNRRYIKKVDIDSYNYKDGLLEKKNPKKETDKYFTGKDNMYDNFISIDHNKKLRSSNIFREVEQVGNRKDAEDNSLFKKTSYQLKYNFKFAFYFESEFELKDSFITLGGETSTFKMSVSKTDDNLDYQDKNGYLTLLSDAFITVDIKDKKNCKFAITSEISFGYLQNRFDDNKRVFKKSKNIFLYEKGSVFIEQSDELIADLNNKNLQKIGLNMGSLQ